MNARRFGSLVACALVAACGSTTATPSANGPAAHTPTPMPTQSAPLATATFNEMMLDADTDAQGQWRTFTFTTDGTGPVAAVVVKNANASGQTRLCISVDGGVSNCQDGATPSVSGTAATDHSTWVVKAQGIGGTTPTVDIAMTWPTNTPSIALTHGRLQGSLSPGVAEALNGFNVTFAPREVGTVSVEASWTVILTYVDLSLADVTSLPWINVDEQQLQGGGSGVGGVQPPYTHAVDAGKTYRFMLRNLSADNYRPDLSATISFP